MIVPLFAKLPNEVLQQIFLYVPPTSTATLSQVSRRFNFLADHLVWRHYCRSHFRYWEQSRCVEDKFREEVYNVDWKRIFADRLRIDRETRCGLESVLSSQRGRIEKIQQILLYAEDAKDALLSEISTADDAEDVLARRYYSGAILGCIHRTRAIKEWIKLLQGAESSLENALGAFDMFIAQGSEWDSEAISERLDELALGIRLRYPGILEQSPRQKAILIAQHLRESGFTGSEDVSRYLDLQNNFLGTTLHDHEHPSLPLISVAVYCSVAKRLDLNAVACNYPWHVFAVIYPGPGQDLDGNTALGGLNTGVMYMDPYRTHVETPAEGLLAQLRTMGVSGPNYSSYMMGASVIDMTLRAARNIIHSVQSAEQTVITGGPRSTAHPSTLPDSEGAFYGALWASFLLGMPSHGDNSPPADIATMRNRRQFLAYIVKRLEVDFPFDVSLVEDHVLPIFETYVEGRHLGEIVRDVRNADSIPKRIKARTGNAAQTVLYKVGQVFQHKRYHYQAVITGWDAECAAHETWMTHMRVDDLARGRHQSFYNVLVADKSVRYVAEDNIEIITPEVPHSLMDLAGRYFKRWNKETHRFISNIKDEYPDD